jgi:hypothetical protein
MIMTKFLAHLKSNPQIPTLICAIITATLGIEFSSNVPTAHADVVSLLQCEGVQTVTRSSSGIITIEGLLSPCISLNQPTITSGKYKYNVVSQGTQSCIDISSLAPSDLTYSWNNGTSSTVRYYSTNKATGAVATTIEGVGQVIFGNFINNRVVSLNVSPNLTQCLSPSSTVNSVVTLTFSQP